MEETVLGNRYKIIRKIGDGGMAFVYEAKDRLLNRVVAVKVLRPEFADDEEFLAKFKREAEAVANINHPNIVNVYDVGEENKIHYIVMEFVDGQNLKEIIKNEGTLDEYTALDITKQIARALSAAHKKGVIHRDIKPHNILISNEGRHVKVADFGIAKAVSNSTITNIGSIIGSVHYFSPEQAKGQPVANNADLYSLGIVLYEMIIGRVPFRGDSPISIALQHINDNIEFTREEKTKIPHSIRTLISKLTEKSAEDRYQSAEEVIEDIEYIEKNIDLDFIKQYDSYVTQKIDSEKINQRLSLKGIDNDKENNYKYIEDKPKKKNTDENRLNRKPKKSKNPKNYRKILIVALLILLGVGGGFYIKNNLLNSSASNSDVQSIPAPNFVGKNIDDVSREANNLGISIIPTQEYNSEVEEGYIISQTPLSGSTLKPGDSMSVVVSLGGRKVEVPECVSKTVDEAEAILRSKNLRVGNISYEYSSKYEKDIVIAQSPDVGSSVVVENTGIDLIVSKGPKPEQQKPSDSEEDNSSQDDNKPSEDNNDENNNSGDNSNDNQNNGDSSNPNDESNEGNQGDDTEVSKPNNGNSNTGDDDDDEDDDDDTSTQDSQSNGN